MAKKNFAEEAEKDAGFTPRAFQTATVDRRMEGTRRLGGATTIELTRISPDPTQVRQQMDLGSEEMVELAGSIRAHGVLQPLTVFYDKEAEVYRIISGERRYHASKMAGLDAVPCIVRDRAPQGAEVIELQLIENLHRKGMSPIDEAKAYLALQRQHGFRLEEIGRQVGKSKSHISKVLRLCDLAPEVLQEVATSQLSEKPLSFEHMLEISRKDTAEEQHALLEKVRSGNLNVRELRKEVKGEAKGGAGRPKYISHQIQDPEGEFKLVIHFKKTRLGDRDIEVALKKALSQVERTATKAADE